MPEILFLILIFFLIEGVAFLGAILLGPHQEKDFDKIIANAYSCYRERNGYDKVKK